VFKFLAYFEDQWIPLLDRFARFSLGDTVYDLFWTNSISEGQNSRVDKYLEGSQNVHSVPILLDKMVTYMKSASNTFDVANLHATRSVGDSGVRLSGMVFRKFLEEVQDADVAFIHARCAANHLRHVAVSLKSEVTSNFVHWTRLQPSFISTVPNGKEFARNAKKDQCVRVGSQDCGCN
jgi:hypothetical protein